MSKSFRTQIAEAQAKVVKLNELIAALEVKAANEIDYSKVVEGASVGFNYGKAPNIMALTGTVLGRKDPEPGQKGGTFVRIAFGAGFNAQLVSVNLQAVTSVAAEVSAEPEASAE